MTANWSAVWVSLQVGALGAAGGLALGLWLAWTLFTREFRGKSALEAAMELPAVAPLILGTYLAFLLAGQPEAFSWRIAALAAGVSALPGTVRAARAGFEALPREYEMAARSLGASGRRVFWRVAAPLAPGPILAAAGREFGRLAVEYAITLLIAAPAAARGAALGGPLLPSVAVTAFAARFAANRLERWRART
jgi:molybdate transport system permease protein